MTIENSSALPPLMPHTIKSGEKAALAVTVVVNILQIGGILMGASSSTQGGLFALASLMGLFAVLWAIDLWPRNWKHTLIIFVLGLLIAAAVGLLASGQVRAWWQDRNRVQQPMLYYLLVKAYSEDNGVLDQDTPLPQIPFVVADMTGRPITHKTGRNGSYLLPLYNYGPMTIIACGVAQLQTIAPENSSNAAPLIVKIGIDTKIVNSCRNAT
jgi:hypothetical protein